MEFLIRLVWLAQMNMNNTNFLKVSQLNRYLKTLLQSDPVLQDVYVLGEISNYKLHTPSGHMYFTLKDEGGLLRCVFYRGKNAGLNFRPDDGMRVLARGSVSLYEKGGNYQLYVEMMEPEGLGTLFLAYEQLKERLRLEGLFDPEHKKPLPFIPRKIGLITSPTGAAIKDFLTTLTRRFPCVNVIFAPAAVQGDEAAAQITAALGRLQAVGDLDVIVIARGGGSLEDLWSFNDEDLARAIFRSKIPVISAVGHETDFTIADFVADLRAATPTAAAELLTPELQMLLEDLWDKEEHLGRLWEQYCQRQRAYLERFSANALLKLPLDIIAQGKQRADEAERLIDRSFKMQLKFEHTRQKHLLERLEALHPLRVMERGFVYVLDKGKRLVNSVHQLHVDKEIDLIFKNGEAGCKVNYFKEMLHPAGNEE